MTLRHHSLSIRGIHISDDGQNLFTISADKSIKAVNSSGSVFLNYEDAHNSAINKFLFLSENEIATGDDDGVIKLWDIRTNSNVMQFNKHQDFISGLCYNSENSTLLSVSGDCTLCAYDLRNSNITHQSDEQESEFTSIELIKGNRKVVCGNQEGVLLLFSWNRWGDCSDRYPGHPDCIECLNKIDESTVLTGSGDGLIRVISIQPNKILGVIGDHDNFPVEGLLQNHDGKILVSFSHDEIIRFWDISMFLDSEDDDENECNDESDAMMINDDDDDDDDDDGSSSSSSSKKSNDNVHNENDDSENDDSDSDESNMSGAQNNPPKRYLSSREKFYSDL